MVMAGNQPYFMPYIGYWQLIHASDVFILSDDYLFIEGGWISRNRILQNGAPLFFNIELDHSSSVRKINQILLSDQFSPEKKLRQLQRCYGKAPYFASGYALMKEICLYPENNLALFLEHSIRKVCEYCGITTRFLRSSDIPGNDRYKREYRIYDQCRYVGADTYINAIGGQKLYSYEQFRSENIRLGFIQTQDVSYKQFKNDFIPNLSILDVIMFNSGDEIRRMLDMYTILWENTALPQRQVPLCPESAQ